MVYFLMICPILYVVTPPASSRGGVEGNMMFNYPGGGRRRGVVEGVVVAPSTLAAGRVL